MRYSMIRMRLAPCLCLLNLYDQELDSQYSYLAMTHPLNWASSAVTVETLRSSACVV